MLRETTSDHDALRRVIHTRDAATVCINRFSHENTRRATIMQIRYDGLEMLNNTWWDYNANRQVTISTCLLGLSQRKNRCIVGFFYFVDLTWR